MPGPGAGTEIRQRGEVLADLDRESVETSLPFERRRRNWLRPLLYAMFTLLLLAGGWWVYTSMTEGTEETVAPKAYQACVSGLRSLTDCRYDAAELDFRAALQSAPDFTMARYRLATVLATTGRLEAALEEISRAAGEASKLSDRESRYVRAAEAWYNRRYDKALAAYQDLLEAYPYGSEARLFLPSSLAN